MTRPAERQTVRFEPRSRVEVWSRFDGHWIEGFTVEAVELDEGGAERVRLRRPDGSVLPAWFQSDELRPV